MIGPGGFMAAPRQSDEDLKASHIAGPGNMVPLDQAIANQEARKALDRNLIKRMAKIEKGPSAQRVTKTDVKNTAIEALESVARDIRFKIKETPGWAMAYASALAVIEAKITEVKNAR